MNVDVQECTDVYVEMEKLTRVQESTLMNTRGGHVSPFSTHSSPVE